MKKPLSLSHEAPKPTVRKINCKPVEHTCELIPNGKTACRNNIETRLQLWQGTDPISPLLNYTPKPTKTSTFQPPQDPMIAPLASPSAESGHNGEMEGDPTPTPGTGAELDKASNNPSTVSVGTGPADGRRYASDADDEGADEGDDPS